MILVQTLIVVAIIVMGLVSLALFRHGGPLPVPTQEGVNERMVRLGIKCPTCGAILSKQFAPCGRCQRRMPPPPPPPLPPPTVDVGRIEYQRALPRGDR